MSKQLGTFQIQRSIALACTSALAIGIFAGYMGTATPTGGRRPPHAGEWTLPEVVKRLNGNPAAMGVLLQHNPFGVDGSSAQPSTTGATHAAGLQLVGVVEDPQPKALFYSFSDQQLLRVGSGESLPGYGVVRAIEHNAVTINLDKCEKTITLFSQAMTLLSGCEPKPAMTHDTPQKIRNHQ